MPSSINLKVSDVLYKMSLLGEIEGINPFKVRAYKKASEVIKMLERDISLLSDDEILKINGIGNNMLKHIKDIIRDGTFPEYEKLLRKYPISLLDLFTIPGLGAKRIKILYEKLSIDSKEKLYKAAKNGDLSLIEGFGEKIAKNIIDSIERGITQQKRFLISEAMESAKGLVDYIRSLGYSRVEYAGSLRRGKETIGDIDILVEGNENLSEDIVKYPLIEKVIAKGSTKVSIILKNSIQCDIRIVKPESFGAALCYFTGSKEHNIALRELALKNGFVLNEYGLFKKGKVDKAIAGRSEEEIYKALNLQYIPPELRENQGEIELAMKGRIPKLIELKDIKGDIHCHTNMTDGASSIYEIVEYLSSRYEWFFIGDHSIPLHFVKGLDFRKYLDSRNELLKLREKFRKVDFDRSIELEVLKDGSFAFGEEELGKIALVIAAAHTSAKMKKEELTQRIIKALSNPFCDVFAHLSQRLLFQREELDLDYDLVFQKAKDFNSVFEVNGQPDRLDLKSENIRKVKSLGLKVILSSDAHSLEQFSYIEYALKNARRAGVQKEDVLNTYSYRELNEFFQENRKRRMK
ncbi:MAG: DNA polymerase/3'-5' exonuclease PolX [Elusimicrobiales bacterium]|nr:DNA polymerase/3'-5' exonuclease PolX [Elusimicrobiales bacterium]